MPRYMVYGHEYVWYEGCEIEAIDENDAEEQYRELFGDPGTCPEITDSDDFCVEVEAVE